MASEFYLVLPSNSSMVTHPNNTLAQYITNLPSPISLSVVWECSLTEIHYPHDWCNVRNARLTVEHDGNVETGVCFEDGYYRDKPGRVKFSYEPVSQKFIAHVKSKTKFTLYEDLPDILGFGARSGDSTASLASSAHSMFVRASSIVNLRRGFESLYVYSSIVEPRIVGVKIAPLLRILPITGRHGDSPFPPRPVHSRAESIIRWHRNRDKGRHGPTSATTTTTMRGRWMVDAALRSCPEGALFGSLFSGLPRTVASLIRQGAVALGKRALTTGAQIAGDVVAG